MSKLLRRKTPESAKTDPEKPNIPKPRTDTSTTDSDISKPKSKYTVSSTLVNIYLVLMFAFFPLFLTEQYVHARTDKFWLYLGLSAVLIILVAFFTLVEGKDKSKSDLRSSFLPLSVTDILMLCFIGFAAISTVLSSYITESFTGNAGRNNGLGLLLAYTAVYFILTRHFAHKDYVFAAYLAVSSFVALLAVLNFYHIDPLNIYEGYDEATKMDFGSTIGNKNILATFMCIFLPVAVGVFTVAKEKYLRFLSGCAIGFAYTGLLCADSTSDIFGLLVILPVMLIFYSRSYAYLKRYFLALTILFASGKLLYFFSLAIDTENKGFEFIQEFLIFNPLMFIPIVLCGGVTLLLWYLGRNDEPKYPAKQLQITFLSLFIAGALGALGAFIYFSFIDRTTDIGEFEKLLRFDDYWGTHRGYMWRISMEEYSRFDYLHRFFGSGPDTAFKVLEPHFPELAERFGDSSTDCAHNEFINYLLTQGAFGLTAYLGLAGAVIVRGLKTAKKNPWTLVFLCAVICYLAQSTVNLYNPIVTPVFFIFLSLTEALNRKESVLQTEKAK